MSAAATAAGYLYASGRLRGRGSREQDEEGQAPQAEEPGKREAKRPRIERPRREVRVASLPPHDAPRQAPGAAPHDEQAAAPRTRRQPTIQYRTRRWRPDEAS